jgi:hypothetical protein
MKSRMRELRSTTAAGAVARLALALWLSGAACLFGGSEPEPSTAAAVAPTESNPPPEEPPARAEIEPETPPVDTEPDTTIPAIGASLSDGDVRASQDAGSADPAASEPADDPAAPSDSPGSGAPAVPGPPRSIKVLQRVDENGVTHYVIQPADDSSGDAGDEREPGDDLAPVSAAPPAAPAKTAAEPEAASADDASEPTPSTSYSATADESATAATARDLEVRIRQDREAIKNLITEPDTVNPAEDPRLREIADRLPRLQAELAALRNERQP